VDAPVPGPLTDDQVDEALRRAGLRRTGPRRRVYAALRGLGGHRSADEVHRALRGAGSAVSRMSVYNALEDLGRAGVVREASVGPGRTLFEARTGEHHHLLCRACGRVVDVPCLRGRRPCLDLPRSLGTAEEAQVLFRGHCAACRTRGRRRKAGPAHLAARGAGGKGGAAVYRAPPGMWAGEPPSSGAGIS
jgi:Fur family ferric uptake transcriptional regulator